jgi:hypothetical protein
MTFELTRLGWPNTAAILALAMLPMAVALTVATGNGTAQPGQASAFCPVMAKPAVILAAGLQTLVE